MVMVSSTSRHKVAAYAEEHHKSMNPPHLCPFLVFFIQSIHILLVVLSCSICVNHFESVDLFASDPRMTHFQHFSTTKVRMR